MAYSVQTAKRPRRRKILSPLLIGVALVALVVVMVALEATNTTHLFHSAPVAKTATIPTTQQSPSSSKDKSSSSSSSSSSNSTTDNVAGSANKGDGDTGNGTPTTQSGDPPETPSGTFISNHTPSLSGSPYPSQEQSVCNTTPGASCQIVFTKDDLTRSLPTQTTNSDGSALWTWDVNAAGFTEGTWNATVTATLNGKTATATDTLKVGP
ncbi:MAG TPA: hypothetical protein VJP80_07465 [Candidatus Saccharimonadales bacterium]|nr:hypothetical protein [Candidatus Saccharimonadales bacterium]